MQHFSAVAKRLFGHSEHEAIGPNVSSLMPEPDSSRPDSSVINLRRSKRFSPSATVEYERALEEYAKLSSSQLAVAFALKWTYGVDGLWT
jgi:hypothetical protein